MNVRWQSLFYERNESTVYTEYWQEMDWRIYCTSPGHGNSVQ